MRNLVIIMPDQYRVQALGFWRQEAFRAHLRGVPDPVHTPNLDALAAESLVLSRATATAPVCSPFRGMCFSGRYPDGNGVPTNCGHDRPDCYLRPDVTTLTDALTAAGYDCGYIGKYHLDFPHVFDPARPDWYPGGWDVYTPAERRHGCVFWHSYGTYDVHKNPHYWDADGSRHDPKCWSPRYEADVAASFITNANGERDLDRPFALIVSMNPPHTPNDSVEDCEAEDLARYADRPLSELLVRPNADVTCAAAAAAPYYFAQVTGVDRAAGRILGAIDAAGVRDDTAVLFMADHGELLVSHGERGKNAIYSECFDIPFILRAPGRVTPQVDDLLLGAVDVMPTLLGVLGLSDSTPPDIDGVDYSGLWCGGPAPQRPQAALFLRNLPGPADADGMHRGYHALARGVKTHRYTLACERTLPDEPLRPFVFDDDADPYQQRPLGLADPDVPDEELLGLLTDALARADDPWARDGVMADLIAETARG